MDGKTVKDEARGMQGGGSGRGWPEATGGLVSAGHPLGVALSPPPGPFTSHALLDPAEPLEIEQPGLPLFHLKPSGPPSPYWVTPVLGHCEGGDICVPAAGQALSGGVGRPPGGNVGLGTDCVTSHKTNNRSDT